MQETKHALIDWISFTVPVETDGKVNDIVKACGRVNDGLTNVRAVVPELIIFPDMVGHGRRPYNAGVRFEEGMTVYFNPGQPHALIEVSGRGCEWLRRKGYEAELLEVVTEQVTRLDLAVDIKTDVMPEEFVIDSAPRMTTRTTIDSDTGSTRYIGSEKSDRFCRVYRYFPPHPRSDYLRIEMVHRREIAKHMALSVVQFGVEAACEAAGASYSWQHRLWSTSYADRLPTWRQDTHAGGTLTWFFNAVVPAVRKLLKTGALTPEEVATALFTVELDEKAEARQTHRSKHLPVKESFLDTMARIGKEGSGDSKAGSISSLVKRNTTGGYND